MSVVAPTEDAQPRTIPPAIGFGRRLPARALGLRVLVLCVLLALAAGALGVKAASRTNDEGLPPLQGVAVVTPHLMRGGQPDDVDFIQLRDGYQVRAIVNLRLDGNAEAEIAASFGLDCLSVPVAVGEAPTAADLTALASFMRRYNGSTDVVYLHDDDGGGRAITTGLMLLLLTGKPLDAAMSSLSAEERSHLTPRQSRALVSLSEALTTHDARSGNPYRTAASLRW